MATVRPGAIFCTLLILLFLTWRVVYAEDEFCQDQETIFHECSNRMEFIYLVKSQSLDVLCKEISQYLSCVQETNVSCPDMPIFQDRVYTEAVQNAVMQLTRFCKGYSIVTTCNEKFVDHLVSKCTTILNKVQVETPREDMCQYSKEYLACLQRATEVCRNSAEFLLHNVPLAIASTESSLKAVCDDIQEDAPDSHVSSGKFTAHWLCSREIIRKEIDKCTAHVEHAPQVMDVNGCRHQHMFVSCLSHLLQNCPNADETYKIMLTVAEETYSILCSEFKCPKEIAEGEEDAVSYCMKDFYNVEPSAAVYCRKLQLVPECIHRVSRICPPSQSPFKLEGALRLIHTILVENCGDWVTSKN